MGDSGGRKRSKKSKREKRAKASKKARLAARAERSQAPLDEPGVADTLSESSQAVVIELQRTELSRLLREQQRLNERTDQLLQLLEREQVLRQQMQASLDTLTVQRALPTPERDEPPRDDAERRQLVERVDRAEGKFAALQSALARLVAVLERQIASAQ